MLSDRLVAQAAQELHIWGAVAVIGAGASLQSGFPLIKHLQALVWHALDADPEARDALAALHGWPGKHAKDMIGEDWSRGNLAYAAIAKSPQARARFQRGFAALDHDRSRAHSPAHAALAELLHRGVIESVVSFNWDTLLEHAYFERYGRHLSRDATVLFKPHGDARHPEEPWTLPHEDGIVPPHLLRRVQQLTEERPRALLVVGYSERDEAVVQQLIHPLDQRWRVIRIGPTAQGELALPASANEALPAVLSAMQFPPEARGWHYVRFDHQHTDLKPALSGAGLTEKDVEICPRLPDVSTAVEQLHLVNRALLVGESGSGKSMTAYQAAYELHNKGREVLRLEPGATAPDLAFRSNLRFPTLLLVDDAQRLPSPTFNDLFSGATPHVQVLATTPAERPNTPHTVQVSGSRAVRAIAQALRTRYAETLDAVRAFDHRVGEGYLQINLQAVLDEAEKAKTPWEFAFTLTSGWARLKPALAAARDADRADLLLLAIALGQRLTLDTGISADWLDDAARAIGRDGRWVTAGLEFLRTHRLITDRPLIRCPHLQLTSVVLEAMFDPSWDASSERGQARQLLAFAMQRSDASAQGLLWLLVPFTHHPLSQVSRRNLVPHSYWTRLVAQAWRSDVPEERRTVLWLLKAASDWSPDVFSAVHQDLPVLVAWFRQAEEDYAFALADFFLALKHHNEQWVQEIVRALQPSDVAALVRRMKPSAAYGLVYLVGWLLRAGEPEWTEAARRQVDLTDVRRVFETATPDDIDAVGALAVLVQHEWEDEALQLIEPAVPMLARAFSERPAASANASWEHAFYALGSPHFGTPKPSTTQRTLGRKVAAHMNMTMLAAQVNKGARRQWQDLSHVVLFARQHAPKQMHKLVRELDVDMLDRSTEGLWAELPHELIQWLGALAITSEGQPARTLLERHAEEVSCLESYLIPLAPPVFAAKIREGARLDLKAASGWHWGEAVRSLAALADVDPEVARQVIEQNVASIAEGLGKVKVNDADYLGLFLQVLQELAPDSLGAVSAALEMNLVEQAWTDLAQKSKPGRQALAWLWSEAEAWHLPDRVVILLETLSRRHRFKVPSEGG